jgi:uncharacterized protein YcfL
MNPDNKIICPCCAESINASAKLCPRCRQWLTIRSFRHPLIAFAVGLGSLLTLFVAGVLLIVACIKHFSNPEPYYTAHLDSIKIIESKMNIVETSNGFRVYVTGILTNESEIAWRQIEFDCRFYDNNGVMIDAANGYSLLTVQPHDDSAFRVVVQPGRSTNDYSSCKIFVSTARNTKSLF